MAILLLHRRRIIEGEQPWTLGHQKTTPAPRRRAGFEWVSELDGETSRRRSSADRVPTSRSTLIRPWDRTGSRSPTAYSQTPNGITTGSSPGSGDSNCLACRSASSSWTSAVKAPTAMERTASTSTAMPEPRRWLNRGSPVSCWQRRWSKCLKLPKAKNGIVVTRTGRRYRGSWRP